MCGDLRRAGAAERASEKFARSPRPLAALCSLGVKFMLLNCSGRSSYANRVCLSTGSRGPWCSGSELSSGEPNHPNLPPDSNEIS